jgi:CMP-N,N'-diacetyllegionaminic acid synthase
MGWRNLDSKPGILAVIPARGGSKGIPGKNMKRLGGLTLVGRATQLAVSLPWIAHVSVSTDDTDIAAEVLRQGGDVPFMRPDALASDTASSDDMWRHAWQASEDHYARQFEVSLLLEPTSPLRVAADLVATVDAVLDGGHRGAVTVSPTPAHFSPHKTLTVDADSRIGFLHDQGPRFARRQEVPALFHRNGLCYALRRDSFLGGAPLLDSDCAAIVVDREVVNIDDPFELELADWLLQRQQAGLPDNPTNSLQPASIGKVYASAPGRRVPVEGKKAS